MNQDTETAEMEQVLSKPNPHGAIPRAERTGYSSEVSLVRAEQDWPFPPLIPGLSADEVHIWRANLDELTAHSTCFGQALSRDERARAQRFRMERDGDRFVVRRGLLRNILARYLNLEPRQLSFYREPRGKLRLTTLPGASALHFNLSHSGGLALFAVARGGPVGVDIEQIRSLPDIDRIAAKFFSGRENALLRSLSPEQKREAFFICWTCKEAYLKATGEGIAEVLSRIEILPGLGGPARVSRIGGDVHAASFWSLHAINPAPGFVGSLAVRRASVKLSFWQWSPAAQPQTGA